MEIGVRIKQLRQQRGLTQEELAARTELTKGFISQLERDLTSPSIATLMDILEALGTDVGSFFRETTEETVVYGADDMFVKEEADGYTIQWLVPTLKERAWSPSSSTIPAGVQGNRRRPTKARSSAMCSAAACSWCLAKSGTALKRAAAFISAQRSCII